MKIKKTLALLLVGIMLFSFAACGGDKDDNEANQLTEGAMPDNLLVEKVGSLATDNFWAEDGGLYYKDSTTGKFGVMSLDGNYDTGAIYEICYPSFGSVYFMVAKTNNCDLSKPSTLNNKGLIDGKGNVIIPEAYSYFYKVSDRYIVASKATKIVTEKDNAVLAYEKDGSMHSIGISIADPEKNVLYGGEWCLYDLTTGKTVPGVKGTVDSLVWANGNFISYEDDAGERHVVGPDGKAHECKTLFDDGSYSIEGKIGTVYDTNGNKLFDYDLTSYIPSYFSDGYYVGSLYRDGESVYVVMDKTGKILSSELASIPSFYGDLLMIDDVVCNNKGEKLIQGTYQTIYHNEMFGDYYFLYNNETYTLINSKGEVLFEEKETKTKSVYSSDFLAYDKVDDKTMFYSFKDKAYTIEGHVFAPWLVQTYANNDLRNLVSVISGETILENYNSYDYTTVDDTAYYVYAKYTGGTDIYLIVNQLQLEDLMKKKATLLDDLIASFQKEGITVTVNKETGELSMDSSVLFGGDSAELTDEGKVFLDKFVKAYTAIVYSNEYSGFISKTYVEGHTAPTADSTYVGDMPLSVDRATNVKNYCVSTTTGAAVKQFADNLEAVGYSNSQPVLNADGSVDMDASRRVSFRFMLDIDLLN